MYAGGNLGLFLGMSFLTFAELIEIGFNSTLILIKNYLISRKVRSSFDSTEVANSNGFTEQSLNEDKQLERKNTIIIKEKITLD